jgi:hypothetical protein
MLMIFADQHAGPDQALQLNALQKAGCERIFIETARAGTVTAQSLLRHWRLRGRVT